MIHLIPMAGAGSRFKNEGYQTPKPLIPVTSYKTGKKTPMVVQAARDLPKSTDEVQKTIFIDRDFHKEQGIEDDIKLHLPGAEFITINYLTEGQASTCLLAENFINTDEELTIGACDNGMAYSESLFNEAKASADALIFTFRNHECVNNNPKAYGWVETLDSSKSATSISVKIPISSTPMKNHAIVGSFWFKHGRDFVEATKRMIERNDRINNEFYVDQTMQHVIDLGLNVKVFEIEKYICWGTAKDYEEYQGTINYWMNFNNEENLYEQCISH